MNNCLKAILLDVKQFCRSARYRRLRRSIFFDSQYYLSRYPDVAKDPDITKAASNPILHYLNFGCLELRQPSPLFDPLYYLAQLPNLIDEKIDPLEHYLTEGKQVYLCPNPLFDPLYYLKQIQPTNKARKNPYRHFLTSHGLDTQPSAPSAYFDPDYYSRRYPDVKGRHNPYLHYLTTGIGEGRQPSLWFDASWYLDRYNLTTSPLIRSQDGLDLTTSPLTHYLTIGKNEKKSPSPLFDPHYYSKRYNITGEPDLFDHYLRQGLPKDHFPCPWFDPVFYRQTYLAGEGVEFAPLHHFLETGLKKHLAPNMEVFSFRQKPTISILVPVYNPKISQLNSCIRSVLYQSYPHWELCLVDDHSTRDEIRFCLQKWTAEDPRIKTAFLANNSGISTATNRAAELSTGSYLGFLDNDDELAPKALEKLVAAINRDGGELFYSDEDLIGIDGRQHSIFRKPTFNRELLCSHNYITHFVVTARWLFERVGGCDPLCDGAQDLDLVLKLSEQAETIIHIPEILYHWRATASSTSINHSEKDYANEAGRLAIAKSLDRDGIPATVEYTELRYYYRPRRRIESDFSAALIVYAAPGQTDLIEWLGDLLHLTAHRSFLQEVIIVVGEADKGLSPHQLSKKYPVKIRSVVATRQDMASCYNQGAKGVTADFLVFASTAIKIINRGWLAGLIEYGQAGEIGMVGGRIVCVEEEREPVSHLPDIDNFSAAYYCRFITNCSILMNGRHCPQEVSAVNGEFTLIKTADFNEAGGFNSTDFPCLFATLDLCYRLRRHGKMHIFTPYSDAVWQGNDLPLFPINLQHQLDNEKTTFAQTWQSVLLAGDPFYNEGIAGDNNISLADFHTWRSAKQDTAPKLSAS